MKEHVKIPPNSICVIGQVKTNNTNPITYVHQSVIGSFVVDRDTGEIFYAQFNTVCKITNDFLSSLVVGLKLNDDIEVIQNRIKKRYLGDSSKAMQVLVKDAAIKFAELKQKI